MLSLSNQGLGLVSSLFSSTSLTGPGRNRGLSNVVEQLRSLAPGDIRFNGSLSVNEGTFRSNSVLTDLYAVSLGGSRLPVGLTWSIVGGKDANSFSIDAKTGLLRVRQGASFDFEQSSSAEIQVRVTDSFGRSYTETLRIAVRDVNEAPTDIQVRELLPVRAVKGTAVAELFAVDQDKDDRHSFRVVGRGSDLFEVKGKQLLAKKTLEAGEYSVEVCVTDKGGLSYSEVIRVKIGAANNAPVDIQLSNSFVPENAGPNKVVGTLSAIDDDLMDTHTFAIVGGTDASKFLINGNSLVLRDSQNFENLSGPLNVQVRASDRAGASVVKDFNVTVTDVNEAPVSLEFRQNGTIFSTAKQGALVGLAVGVDPDREDALTYVLSGRDAALFNVDEQGVVRLNGDLGWNSGNPREFTLTAVDRGGLSISQTYQVRAQGVAPEDIFADQQSIEDGTPAGSVVATFGASGMDATNSVTWMITGGPDANRFTVVGNQLITLEDISLTGAGNSRSVVVRATEMDGSFYEKVFTFGVTPRETGGEDAVLTGLLLSDYAVSEGMPVNHTVATLLPQGGATDVVFSITGGADASKFAIVGDKLVLLTQEYSFMQPQLNVQVTAVDSRGNEVSNDFSINVLAANYVAGSGLVSGTPGVPDVFMPDGSTGVMTILGFHEGDYDQIGMYFLFSQDQISNNTVRFVGQNDMYVTMQVNTGGGEWFDFAILQNAVSKNGILNGDGVADALTAEQLDALTTAWLQANVIHS